MAGRVVARPRPECRGLFNLNDYPRHKAFANKEGLAVNSKPLETSRDVVEASDIARVGDTLPIVKRCSRAGQEVGVQRTVAYQT
jgi:hypothetical protein